MNYPQSNPNERILCGGDINGYCTCTGADRRYCLRDANPKEFASNGCDEPVPVSHRIKEPTRYYGPLEWKALCPLCGKMFYRKAMRANFRGEKVCPRCLKKSGGIP